MPYQSALTIVAPVRAGEAGKLDELLKSMGDGVANGSVIDFSGLTGVHYARIVMLEETVDLENEPLPAQLILMSDLDISPRRHLRELVAANGEGIDRVFGHCEGYTPGDRLGYLRRHVVQEPARYVNTVGRTAEQIIQEAQLREAIQRFLDESGDDWSRIDPGVVRARVRELVERTPELAWARRPAEQPSGVAKLRETVHMVAIPLLLLPLLPLALLGAPFYLIALRRLEKTDPAPHLKPSEERVTELAALEDHMTQNPFMAVGFVKPGRFREWTLRGVVFAISYVTRHVLNRGDLAGVKTIHFARWVFLDGRRRMYFSSNYDGSLESYMDDFIDKISWGLNIVFSNGFGYPRAKFLVFGGARDELAFKDYLRTHMALVRVWYAPYGQLTAENVARNERIRAGLYADLDRDQELAWVRDL
jgi:hypothetical protein